MTCSHFLLPWKLCLPHLPLAAHHAAATLAPLLFLELAKNTPASKVFAPTAHSLISFLSLHKCSLSRDTFPVRESNGTILYLLGFSLLTVLYFLLRLSNLMTYCIFSHLFILCLLHKNISSWEQGLFLFTQNKLFLFTQKIVWHTGSDTCMNEVTSELRTTEEWAGGCELEGGSGGGQGLFHEVV